MHDAESSLRLLRHFVACTDRSNSDSRADDGHSGTQPRRLDTADLDPIRAVGHRRSPSRTGTELSPRSKAGGKGRGREREGEGGRGREREREGGWEGEGEREGVGGGEGVSAPTNLAGPIGVIAQRQEDPVATQELFAGEPVELSEGEGAKQKEWLGRTTSAAEELFAREVIGFCLATGGGPGVWDERKKVFTQSKDTSLNFDVKATTEWQVSAGAFEFRPVQYLPPAHYLICLVQPQPSCLNPEPHTTPESKKGSPKSISPSRQLFSKVECADIRAFECIESLQYSGVAVVNST